MNDFFEKRVVIIDGPIDDKNANLIVAELVALNESPYNDIFVLIDSPGGKITSCIAIYDTIRWCKCNVNTVCLKQASALAALLLASGTKGKRYAFLDSLIVPTLFFSIENDKNINSQNSMQINSIIDKIIKILADNTYNSIDAMRYFCFTEQSFDPQSAEENGFIDFIINEEINNVNCEDAYNVLKNHIRI